MTHGDGKPAPTVSIGMPVYNGEDTLAEALDSLLTQTFRDFEVVSCDNASTDRTPAIVEEYAKRDDRVRYHRAYENRGVAANFSWAFKMLRAHRRAAACRDPHLSGSKPFAQARELLALRAHLEIRTLRYLSILADRMGRPVYKGWSRLSESFLAPDAPDLWALRLWRGAAAAAGARFDHARRLLDPREAADLLTESLGRLLDRGRDQSLRLLRDWVASHDPEKARLDALTWRPPMIVPTLSVRITYD